MKKNKAKGVITFHSPLAVSLWGPEECAEDVTEASESGTSPSEQPSEMTTSSGVSEKEDAASTSKQPTGLRHSWRTHAFLRRLQVMIEAEKQQATEMIEPILDTEKGFVKEVERFLSQRNVTELRKRELHHKRWTERVWFPLQRSLEEHVASCGAAEVKRRLSIYNHYLHRCNTKGPVFLETYNLKDYNPFFLNGKKPHHFKLGTADIKDNQTHERLQGKRTARSFEIEQKYKLPQRDCPVSESVPSQAYTPLQVSFTSPLSATSKPLVEGETDERKSRLDNIPYHISVTSTPDGRCHRSGCWLSRCGCRQQRSSSHRSLPISK